MGENGVLILQREARTEPTSLQALEALFSNTDHGS